MPEVVLIYNPGSGKKKGGKRAIDFMERWIERFGTEPVLRPTQSKEDIRLAVKETYQSGIIQIFMGGDGTISECLQGLSELKSFSKLEEPVGILPAGSGNSFLRDFALKNYEEARDALLDAIANTSVRKVDMGFIQYQKEKKTETRIFCNIFGVGVIPHIADLAMKMRFLGSFNYTFATLLKLIRHRPMEFRAIIDGIEERLRSDFISICNSKYTGGAMIMAKDVEVDDGKLYMVSPLMESKLRILKLFPSIFSGKHLEHPRVRHHFIQKMKIQYREPLLLLVDGELEKGENPEISISPGHWNLFMTKKPS